MSDVADSAVLKGTTMLMGWGESDTQGPWIKLRLADSDALAPFRGMTKAKGDKAGQLLAVVAIEVDGNDQPVQTKPKGGPLSKLAAQWGDDPMFRQWALGLFAMPYTAEGIENVADRMRLLICDVCGVTSRAEIDNNDDAARRFHTLLRIPFRDWLANGGQQQELPT